MKQNTKHNLALLVVWLITFGVGYLASRFGQGLGFLAGVIFMGCASSILWVWFPMKEMEKKK